MNKKAEDLGLKNTHFVTPHGLDQDEHYTTAHELAIITDYALTLKKFSTIVNTKQTTININGNTKTISNTNELLGNLNGVDGVKTGFTNNAGRCLVTSTTRNGHQIICVVLGADTKKIRTQDSIKLIEYTFLNYEYVNIKEKIEEEFTSWKAENLGNITIIKGKTNQPELELCNLELETCPINKNSVKDLSVEIKCNTIIQAPVMQNQTIGKIEVKVKDEIITTLDIIAKEKIEKKEIMDYMKELIIKYNTYIQTAFTN